MNGCSSILRIYPSVALLDPLSMFFSISFRYNEMVAKHPAARSFSSTNKLAARLSELRIKDPKAIHLLEQLLTLDPKKRISAAEAAMVRTIS